METKRFEFNDFVLDSEERVLLKSGEPVSITPKALNLLQVLLENRGRIVERDELLKAVWHDSFVEDGNLAFTISLLRKALDDSTQDPRFVETVPRRGYRFIAEVKEVPDDITSANGRPPDPIHADAINKFSSRNRWIPLTAAILTICGIIIAGLWGRGTGSGGTLPVLSQPFASEKLSTNGRVFTAAISPDGKTVVYTDRKSGQQSIWIRQLESGNNIEIIPPSDDSYYEFVFSPDGTALYFSRRPSDAEIHSDIYRVSIFGGIPTKIASEAQGWVSISRDGTKLSFVRCYYREDEYCSLWVADADGTGERKLVSRPSPFRIGDNEISPDGRTIAFAVGQSRNAANEFSLAEVDIESGVEGALSSEKFFNIKHLTWFPDQSGLFVTASKIPNKHFRIWQVSAETGEAQPLTRDSETYSILSLNKDANAIVSTQIKEDFRLRVFEMENAAESSVLAEASRAAFTSDGKILISSIMSGNSEVWSLSTDGKERRQLTNDPADDIAPVVSPDNASIFFVSNRTGEAHCWRMNADGSDQTQVTHAEGGFPIFVSPDGNWLYYHHAVRSTLWRVSLKSGEEQVILDKPKFSFEISADGTRVVSLERHGDEKMIVVASLPDGQVLRTFRPAIPNAQLLELKWLPSGKALAYILANNAWEQNALWMQPLDSETPRKVAELGDEEISDLAFSPNGKSVAVAQGGWKHDAVLLKGLR